ncbi:MAG: type II toxin-antitoxin system death-on-curing family toxin [Actinomycetota bacterium]
MQYLTADDVARINARVLGQTMLRDFGLLDSATQRPHTTAGGEDAYPTVHDKAAALFHSLCRNHAFENGNKRTALIALNAFYNLNQHDLVMDDGDLVALAVDTAEGYLSVDAIASTLRKETEPWPTDEENHAW